MNKGKVFRGWCEMFTKCAEEDDEQGFSLANRMIIDTLETLTKEEQQEIFSKDLLLEGFVNNFHSFKKLIKE